MPAIEHTQHVAWTRNKAVSVSWHDKQKLPVLFIYFLIISAMISYAHVKWKESSEMTDTRVFITFGKDSRNRFNLTKI